MPNYVKNTIYFDCSETKVHEILTAIQDDEKGYGTIDFNKLIPMPESLNITAGSQTNDGIKLYSAFVDGYRSSHPQLTDDDLLHIPESEEQAYLDSHADIDEETFHLGKASYRNTLLYGYPTWYEWSNEQWNTKWNAYHCSMEDEYTISFETAWCAPHPVIEELSARFTGVYMIHCWADEDLGHNCGRFEYLNGECVGDLTPENNANREVWLYLYRNSGDVTVYVKDSKTGMAISGAGVSGAASGTTDSSGKCSFSGISFMGVQTFSASKEGYYGGSASTQLSRTKLSDTITIYLDPIPTSGDITVYVRDNDTGTALSGASVSGNSCYGTTDSNGSITFTELDFGSYTFTASLYGYESGSGSGSISEFHTEESITIYLEKIKTDLSVDSEINGTIYQGSTIMVPATVFNDGDVNLTPSLPAKITMTAKGNGSTVFDTQTADVIIPAFGNNLTWFTVTIPETANSVTFDFKVSVPAGVTETNLSNNTDTITAAVNVLLNRACADASLELTPPKSFNYSNYTGNTAETRSWSMWEWNGGFVRKTYTAKLNLSAVLYPDETAGYRKQNGSTWTTRSGYGLDTEVAANVNTNAASSATVGTLKVDIFYPEHNYSTSNNKSDRLELVNGKYVLKPLSSSVSSNRMHATPLWFPDKAYSVKYYAYDIWCPAGMLSGYTNAGVMISGDMYDDLYTN